MLQVNFTLVAGNMEDVFKIKTVNHTYGEVFVNAPLDRESVDRYLLKVRQENLSIEKKIDMSTACPSVCDLTCCLSLNSITYFQLSA